MNVLLPDFRSCRQPALRQQRVEEPFVIVIAAPGVDGDVLDRDLLLALAAVTIERLEQTAEERESLLAWLRFSRRPSKVCSLCIARR